MRRSVSTPLILALAMAGALSGCYSVPPDVRKTPVNADTDASQTRPVGGDRDAHGCLPSAGYRWCAREQRCLRPWELAQSAGIANTADAIDAYCASAGGG